MGRKYCKRLFQGKDPFAVKKSNRLFTKAMRENFAFQYTHCPEYRRLAKAEKIQPEDINGYADLLKLPILPTLLFKHHRIFSIPENHMFIKATSSGTGGVFSKIGFDFDGMLYGANMVIQMAKYRHLWSLRPVNYIILGYQPHKSNQTAVTKTALGATFFAPALHRTFALQYKNGKYEVDLEKIIKTLQKYAKTPFPVRFMGFPSYTYFLLKMMEERGIFLKLPPDSMIMLGGGWKQFYKEQVEKEVLYELAERVLGIREDHIVEFFGAVEHPILYCDCKNHHFHVPIYSRVIIRDVHTMKPLGYDKVGLVQLMTPMVAATPVLSIMTDDLGILHRGETCGCGLKSPYFEIIGRVGLKDIKTCAAGAAEFLQGGSKL